MERIENLELRRSYNPINATWHIVNAAEGDRALLCEESVLSKGDLLRSDIEDDRVLFERNVCEDCFDQFAIAEEILTWA